MALLGTESQRLSNLVKITDSPFNLSLLVDTLVSYEAAPVTYQVGTVLGKVTATGQYKAAVQTAVDGSQTPVAVFISDNFGNYMPTAIPATTATNIVAITRGKAILSAKGLVLDPSFTAGALTTAAYASLKAVGILIEDAI